MAIQGINVQGNGLVYAEIAERTANLAIVKLMEEQERERRIAQGENLDWVAHKMSMNAIHKMESKEQLLRSLSLKAEQRKMYLAAEVSRLIEEHCDDTLREISLMSSTDVLADAAYAGKEMLLNTAYAVEHVGEKAIESALMAKEHAVEKAHQIGNYAMKTAAFFGWKAVAQAQALSDAVTGQAQFLGEKAMEKAHSLTDATLEQALHVREAAVAKVQDLGGFAAEKTKEAVDQAQAFGAHLKEAASDKATELVDKSLESAKQTVEAGAALATEALDNSIRSIDLIQLTTSEEFEREYRMTAGLTAERFLLALRTSDLIKDWEGYKALEPNRWYATAILEEFERKRRFVEDELDSTPLKNAKAVAYFILTHPRAPKYQARAAEQRALRAPTKIAVVEEALPQKTAHTAVLRPSVTGLAAM